MITLALATAAASLLRWVLSVLPPIPVPSWVASAPETIGQLTDRAASVSYIVPVGIVVPCIALVMGCAAIGLGFKLSRIVLSLTTAGGGSAG